VKKGSPADGRQYANPSHESSVTSFTVPPEARASAAARARARARKRNAAARGWRRHVGSVESLMEGIAPQAEAPNRSSGAGVGICPG
jgi:hypothetical protein